MDLLRLRVGEGICSTRSASAATEPAGCPIFVTGVGGCRCCWKAEAIGGGTCCLTAVDRDICVTHACEPHQRHVRHSMGPAWVIKQVMLEALCVIAAAHLQLPEEAADEGYDIGDGHVILRILGQHDLDDSLDLIARHRLVEDRDVDYLSDAACACRCSNPSLCKVFVFPCMRARHCRLGASTALVLGVTEVATPGAADSALLWARDLHSSLVRGCSMVGSVSEFCTTQSAPELQALPTMPIAGPLMPCLQLHAENSIVFTNGWQLD